MACLYRRPKAGNGGWKSLKSEDELKHLNYSMAKIGQNTVKSPGDLRRLAVTQNIVKDYQLTLVSDNNRPEYSE